MLFFDTHAHLDDEQFDTDREGVIRRAEEAGVSRIVTIGTTAASSGRCVKLANQYECVFAAVGIQPNYVAEAGPEDWSTIERLATQPGVIAIGETGLDHYWDYAPLDLQREYFRRHLELSRTTGLPFVVHMREAGTDQKNKPSLPCAEDILAEIRRVGQGEVRGIMHSYTGNARMVAQFIDLGLHISFAGMVTYNKSDALRAVAAEVPVERLLIETDAPYLSPHPKRGQRPNEPALVVHTAACLAEVLDMPLADLAVQTSRNACELFGVEPA